MRRAKGKGECWKPSAVSVLSLVDAELRAWVGTDGTHIVARGGHFSFEQPGDEGWPFAGLAELCRTDLNVFAEWRKRGVVVGTEVAK